jgi:hypothetical protein
MLDHLTGKENGQGHGVLSWLFHKHRASERKLLLFACACCRRVWPLLADERSRWAIEVAEQQADGLASHRDHARAVTLAQAAAAEAANPRNLALGWLAAARARAADAVVGALSDREPYEQAAIWTREAVRAWAKAIGSTEDLITAPALPMQKQLGTGAGAPASSHAPHALGSEDAAWTAERSAQCDLLRELFGNPFRAPAPRLANATAHIRELAETVYQKRNFAKMPELAATLETEGFSNQFVLEHFRSACDHVIGCWGLDLILKKH